MSKGWSWGFIFQIIWTFSYLPILTKIINISDCFVKPKISKVLWRTFSCTTSILKCWLLLIFWAIYVFNFKNFMFVEKNQQCHTNQKVVLIISFCQKEKHEYMQNLISDWIMFLFFSICFLLRHFLVSVTSKVVHLFFGWKEKSLPIQL